MIYFYKVTDITTDKIFNCHSDLDEFSSYRDFIGFLEDMNEIFSGQLRFEEDREKILEDSLTRDFQMV